jgi:hypothetical protein
MALPTQNISVSIPVSQAIEHVKRVLFNPFDAGKWFTIGFCAWLAQLGQGGFGGSYGGGNGRNQNPQEMIQRGRDFLTANLYWIVPVAIALVVIGIVLWVLIVWLSSRGKFMFLHCVAYDKAEVRVPWHLFRREANSLFWFRLTLGLVQIFSILPLLAAIALLIWHMIQRGAPALAGVVGSVGLGLLVLLAVLTFWVVSRLTNDFVVPVMFLRGDRCLAAWSVLRGLLAVNAGGIVLYLLFQILLTIAIGACVLALVLVTCCVAGCLLALPYLGTVLFLPVLLFQRAYSVFYLRQYGTGFDVFVPRSTPAPGLA